MANSKTEEQKRRYAKTSHLYHQRPEIKERTREYDQRKNAVKKQATCHPDRRHAAAGLCRACYTATGRGREFNSVKAACHPDRSHMAKGLCSKCYMSQHTKEYKPSAEALKNKRERQWKRYGVELTVNEYDQMLTSQKGACAICRTPQDPARGRLAVDHDHATGRVRGLLCDYCNRRLLIPRNTPEILESAAWYLRDGGIAKLVLVA